MEPGTVIEGKYRIVRLLGEGGMGAVYEGENIRIHRRVAIKVLHAGVAANAEAVQRFEREAQAAGRIGSEHIVEVLDLGDLPSGDRFMVMEFLEGTSLSGRVKDNGRIPPKELAPIAMQILDGLAAAHGAGIIHRDLKPDNVWLMKSRKGEKDFVKILDFGISKFSAMSGEGGFSMTRTGAVMGTPYYLSPEQAKGAKDVDRRADLYAIGVILYECVTGHVPFDSDTFNGLIMKIAFETPTPPEQLYPDVDAAFGSIISKAMARDPNERFDSSEAFKAALQSWVETGGGVVVPASAAMDLAAVAAQGGAKPLPPGGGTAGAWASQSSPTAPAEAAAAAPKQGSKKMIGIAVAALVGVGALAAVLMKKPAAEPAAAVQPPAVAPAPPAPAAPPPAEPAVTPAPPAPVAAAPASAAASATAAPAVAPAKATTTTRVAARTTTAPKATAAPAKITAPVESKTTSGGRRIHTDF